MRKRLLLSCLAISAFIFTQCSSSKKAAGKSQVVSYTNNIQPILTSNCSPCHFPDKAGRMKALHTYDAAKAEIDDIILRIEKHPGDRGFMPMKRQRLSDSTINVFKAWKQDGLVE